MAMRRTRLISKADILADVRGPVCIREGREVCEFQQEPIPEVPAEGARVRVEYAGACYVDDLQGPPLSPALVKGINTTSLFAGYEVSGVLDAVSGLAKERGFKVGDHVIIFPYDQLSDAGYAEYVTVKHADYLVHLPSCLSLDKASLLPTGGLKAYSAVMRVKDLVEYYATKHNRCNMVLLGSGSLSLWTLHLCRHFFKHLPQVKVVIATTEEEGVQEAMEDGCWTVVHWNEGDYDENIVCKTRTACDGHVDVVIDFVSSQRSAQRALKCLTENSVLLCGSNAGVDVRISVRQLSDNNQSIMGLGKGSVEQLRELVTLIAEGKVDPPKYEVFPLEEAPDVMRRLSTAELHHRAVLQFHKK